MDSLIIIVFIVGYLAIVLEQRIKINKTASALLTGVICWTLFILSSPSASLLASSHWSDYLKMLDIPVGDRLASINEPELFQGFVISELSRHLSNISEILFFLMAAMTIVELVDAHQGFSIITEKINTRKPKKLLWIICWIAFFLSAVLDNLTTSIVMVTLIRQLIPNKEMRLYFVGMIIISANAGGAWTPIGDVTTTMLWIGGQISPANIIKTLFLPCLVCMLAPLVYLSFTLKGEPGEMRNNKIRAEVGGGKLMLMLGIVILLLVPVFKTYTNLPPYAGMLAGLGILWVFSEIFHSDLDEGIRKNYTAAGALSRIDVPSVLFFLGILLAISALDSMQTLHQFATFLADHVGDEQVIITLIGLFSSVVDNVPLVAASMGMYNLAVYPQDHMIWEYLAYCAGTGGSILIIGSAAGVAVMGIEKIDFIWYVRKISIIAMLGYFTGAAAYLALHHFTPDS